MKLKYVRQIFALDENQKNWITIGNEYQVTNLD